MKVRTRSLTSGRVTTEERRHPVAHTPFTQAIWMKRNATRATKAGWTTRTPNPPGR